MTVYVIEHDNGEEYEHNDRNIIGVYDDLDKACDYLMQCGFVRSKDDHTFYTRESRGDYVYIYPFVMNVPGKHRDALEIVDERRG